MASSAPKKFSAGVELASLPYKARAAALSVLVFRWSRRPFIICPHTLMPTSTASPIQDRLCSAIANGDSQGRDVRLRHAVVDVLHRLPGVAAPQHSAYPHGEASSCSSNSKKVGLKEITRVSALSLARQKN